MITVRDGKLVAQAEANGDRIVDFSTAGYAGGDRDIPAVPAKVFVTPAQGDSTALIQGAIDQVAKLPPDADGFRGAVLLGPGKFVVEGQLKLHASGVVLRGSGMGETVLFGAGVDRRAIVHLAGVDDRVVEPAKAVSGSYVPSGSTKLTVPNHGLKAGNSVLVTRPCTDGWTVAMGMDDFGGDRHGVRWNANSRVLSWDRVVTAVDGDTITLDAPITCGLDARFGGGTVAKYAWPGRAINAGVENLTIESAWDGLNEKDESHAWFGVIVENARDAWVRRVTVKHVVSSAVVVWASGSRVTVEDCKSLAPVGEVGGWRRRAFFVEGQQVLMQRLWSENAANDFAVGYVAAGPNAFVNCQAVNSLGDSGAVDSWAAGALFDNIRLDGGNLVVKNQSYKKQGAGWSGVNCVFWNSAAGGIECWVPPMGTNYAAGTRGEFGGDGTWWSSDDGAEPDSLFYGQLAARVGKEKADPRALLLPQLPEGSRSTTPEQANHLVQLSRKPMVTVSDLTDQHIAANPLPTSADGLPIAQAPVQTQPAVVAKPLAVKNGWLVAGDAVVTGGQQGVPWWNGRYRQPHVPNAPALTRFVPGRTGTGYTDDLTQVADALAARGVGVVIQHPPLWYERRRDDHQRVRRSDAEVVPPFYEWPFARSGKGRAYDGLSQWDLTKPNPWYYGRLREFSALAGQRGMVLFNEHYMQHNILEAGAHYADFPWRPANNVNDTGLPEPVAFAGDKLIYMGENFYDVAHNEKLRALHRQYIRTQLDQLAGCTNVVHLTSEEFTGSLSFTQFWIDTIAEWEKETGKDAIVGLYAPKDVTDAILSDPTRSAVVSVIYSRFNSGGEGWYYLPGGKLFAPPGGQNLSPRQWQRFLKPGNAGTAELVRAVSEYRGKYPDKAFVYLGGDLKDDAWQLLMAGASLTTVKIGDAELTKAIASMKPAGENVLAGEHGTLAYSPAKAPLRLSVAEGKSYTLRIVDPKTGTVAETRAAVKGGSVEVAPPSFAPYVAWLEEAK
jgi:hypothetical protein